MRLTAPARLQTWAHASRVQSDEDTYDIERTVVGSVVAGVTADRCGQCGACDRSMVPLELGNREASDMEMTERNKDAPTQAVGAPFAWLVQSTTERNPPHGWAVHMFNGQQVRDAVPVYLAQEVDRLRSERDDHARWRQDLANELDQCERSRDAIGRVLQKRESDLMLLRNAVEKMMAPLGYHGEISARDDRVQAVMDALAQIDAMNDKCQGLDGGIMR